MGFTLRISLPLSALSTSLGLLSVLSHASAVWSATLEAWRFDANQQQLELTVSNGKQPKYFLLARPPRIVVELQDTDLGAVATEKVVGSAVQEIRVSRLVNNGIRIVMEMSPDVVFQPQQVTITAAPQTGQAQRWLVQPQLVQPQLINQIAGEGNLSPAGLGSATSSTPTTSSPPEATPDKAGQPTTQEAALPPLRLPATRSSTAASQSQRPQVASGSLADPEGNENVGDLPALPTSSGVTDQANVSQASVSSGIMVPVALPQDTSPAVNAPGLRQESDRSDPSGTSVAQIANRQSAELLLISPNLPPTELRLQNQITISVPSAPKRLPLAPQSTNATEPRNEPQILRFGQPLSQ